MSHPAPPTISIDALGSSPDFRALGTLPQVCVDLRYASTRNLLGHDLYSPHDCAWLHDEAAAALELSAQWLQAHHPELRLCVLDAARPHRVQELFWTHVQGTPMERYFANPVRRSIHSFGMAVDLTLLDAQGRELDMGTGFDDTTELSHPALEDHLAAQGLLRSEHLRHRALLRHAMQHGGWQGIATEWWHFDFGDRETVRARYRLIV
jgi:D-alanyl-D-alanine dipeptidase